MKKRLLNILQYLLFLGFGVFLIWWSLRKLTSEDWNDIKLAFGNARYLIILPVTLSLLASHWSRAARWNLLIEPLGYSPGIKNTYMAVLIGYLANLAIPRLGEVLKCTILSKYEKVPADKLLGTIVAERAFDAVCLVLVFVFTFLIQAKTIGNHLKVKLSEVNSHLSWNSLLFYLVAIVGMVLLLRFLLNKWTHVPVILKIKGLLTGILNGLTSIRYVKRKGLFIFHTVFIWAMYLLSVQLGLWALEETDHYGLNASLSILSTGSIAMIFTPSGLGAYPLFVQETMQLYGLRPSLGIAFGWLMWTVQFFIILLAGFVSLMLLPQLNKKKHEKHTTHTT